MIARISAGNTSATGRVRGSPLQPATPTTAAAPTSSADRKPSRIDGENRLRPSDIDKIVNTYRNRKEIAKYSHRAKHAEIVENEFNLNIPRYVDTFEEEEEIDVAAVEQEIERLEGELA